MIATEFTDDTGEKIVAELQKGKEGTRKYCSSHVVLHPKKWIFEDVGCYAYTSIALRNSHPDHFGIFHGGWRPIGESVQLYPVGYSRPEVLWWLEALLDPKGMFEKVLPFLWHTEPKEIISDCGFVFKDVLNPVCNAGLLWTFMQATRLMFENRSRMDRFVYLREHHPKLALLLTLTLQPRGDPSGEWSPTVVAHGEPLGTQGWKRAGYVLSGKLTPRTAHQPAGSARCYGGHFPLDYSVSNLRFPLGKWIELFEKAAKDGGLVET